jgi:hypothetical protein
MDNQWLKTQFSLHPDKSKAELARALGLEPPAVSKILAGTRQIKAHEYVAMRRFFGLPVDGDRAARGMRGADSYVLEPLAAPGMTEGEGDKSGEWVIPAQLFVHRTQAPPEQIRIFTVRDSAMAPDFSPGETVLVDLSDTRPSPPGLFVVSDGVGPIIRHCAVVPQSSPPDIRLSARNPLYESFTQPLGQAAMIGRVIARLQWL